MSRSFPVFLRKKYVPASCRPGRGVVQSIGGVRHQARAMLGGGINRIA